LITVFSMYFKQLRLHPSLEGAIVGAIVLLKPLILQLQNWARWIQRWKR